MAYKIIELYARVSSVELMSAGERAGLSAEAVDYFRHAEEYPIQVMVDLDTGAVVRQGIAIVPGGDVFLHQADIEPAQVIGPATLQERAARASVNASPDPDHRPDVEDDYQALLAYLEERGVQAAEPSRDVVIQVLAEMIRAGALAQEFSIEWIDQDHVRLRPVVEHEPTCYKCRRAFEPGETTYTLGSVKYCSICFGATVETAGVTQHQRLPVCKACSKILQPHECEDEVCDDCQAQEGVLMGDEVEPATSAAKLSTGDGPITGDVTSGLAGVGEAVSSGRPLTCFDCDRIINAGEVFFQAADDNSILTPGEPVCHQCYNHRRDRS